MPFSAPTSCATSTPPYKARHSRTASLFRSGCRLSRTNSQFVLFVRDAVNLVRFTSCRLHVRLCNEQRVCQAPIHFRGAEGPCYRVVIDQEQRFRAKSSSTNPPQEMFDQRRRSAATTPFYPSAMLATCGVWVPRTDKPARNLRTNLWGLHICPWHYITTNYI